MKKLSQKQKLIGFIAILIVAVILAIVITKSIIKNNNQVANESYAAITANASSNLIANYILNGITIGGITGKMDILDTNDATALPDDIAWGETAYVKGEKIIGTKIITIAHAKAAQKTFEENTALIDDYGNRVKIPTGFKIAEDSATAVTEGVVIEDVSAGDNNTKGSQFVWIPVGNIITDNNGTTTNINFGRYNFNSSGKETLVQLASDYSKVTQLKTVTTDNYYFQEQLNTASVNSAKAKNIGNFVKKAISSNGYYIGRYELGDATGVKRDKDTNDADPVTCRKGVYPYNFITQPQASSLCQNMYKSANFDSDLMNSFAWDTAIVYIQTFTDDKDYSIQTRLQNTIAKCGEASDGTNKDLRCNIFDMAGNTSENITEGCSQSGNPVTIRGGCFKNDGSYPSVRAYGLITSQMDYRSARPILYL